MPSWWARGLSGALAFPNAANTGPAQGTSLVALPPATSYNAATAGGNNSGWSVTSGGAWTVSDNAVFSGLSIPYNLDLPGPTGVTVENCVITVAGLNPLYGISCRHTTNCTITNCTISGNNAGTGRVSYAIDSIYGDDADLLVQNCNVYYHRIGINTPTTVAYIVQGCFFHDQGYLGFADHNETVTCGQGTGTGLFLGNTMLNQLSQTACLNIGNTQAVTANITAEGNLFAGGAYSVYGAGQASSFGSATSIVIQGNYFSTMYFQGVSVSTGGGQFGPVTDWAGSGGGTNVWQDNLWYDGPFAGQAVPS